MEKNTNNIQFELLYTEYYQHLTAHVRVVVHRILPTSSQHMLKLLYTEYYKHLTAHVRVVAHRILPTSHSTC